MNLIPLFLNYKAEALILGFIFGLANGLFPGPTLTMVITQTLQYNLREGIKIALAPIVFGAVIIPLSMLLLFMLIPVNYIMAIIASIGAVYLFFLGCQLIHSPNLDLDLKDKNASFKKGILVNFTSPYAYLFWFSIGTPLLIQFFSAGILCSLIFLLGYYLLLVGSKILVAYLTEETKSFINQNVFIYILKTLGVVYLVFAFLFLKQAWSCN